MERDARVFDMWCKTEALRTCKTRGGPRELEFWISRMTRTPGTKVIASLSQTVNQTLSNILKSLSDNSCKTHERFSSSEFLSFLHCSVSPRFKA